MQSGLRRMDPVDRRKRQHGGSSSATISKRRARCAWMVVSAWALSGSSLTGQWNGIVAGVLLVAQALPRGPIRERYGAWQSRIV